MKRSEYQLLRKQTKRYKPKNHYALRLILSAMTLICFGLVFSLYSVSLKNLYFFPLWLFGQIVLALGIFQSFLIIHEAGHRTLFLNRKQNIIIGSIASLFCLIPFFPWQYIHRKHHRWTGWKDIDPTTSKALPRQLGGWEKTFIDLAWKFWIPLFCPIYVIDNFWNIPRLLKLTSHRKDQLKFFFSTALIILFWATVLYILPLNLVIKNYALAFFLVMLIADPLMLSQHSHIHQEKAGDKTVAPFPLYSQEIFTRSLTFSPWISKYFLFGFDRHEAHHLIPHISGYYLPELSLSTVNEINCWKWIRLAKSIPGNQLVFLTREETGIWL